MSYILDALKKSEQERDKQRQKTPSLSIPMAQQAHVAGSTQTAGISRGLFVFVSIIAIVCVLILYVLLTNSPASNEVVLRKEVIAQGVTEQDINSMTGNETQLKSSSTRLLDTAVTNTELPSPTQIHTVSSEDNAANEEGVSSSQAQKASIKNNEDRLPYDALKRIPTLDITGHVYSSLAEKRSVTMNGRSWKEGEPLAEGIYLSEITPDGIRLDIDGWPMMIGRSQGWKALTDAH